MDIYKIPQPVPVDITYNVKIFCTKMRHLNEFNKLVLQKFSSRQAYTFVKGHYVPLILNTVSDESVLDIEKRKYYVSLQLEILMLSMGVTRHYNIRYRIENNFTMLRFRHGMDREKVWTYIRYRNTSL